MKAKLLPIFYTCLLLISCSQNSLNQVDFLVGTWKVENKKQYEVWAKESKNKLSGYAYKYINNQKTILETTAIEIINKKLIYSATVPSQNEGKTIKFTLNKNNNPSLSFENLNHDFPKKIQYHKTSKNEVIVNTLGSNNQGFSYKMFKQATH